MSFIQASDMQNISFGFFEFDQAKFITMVENMINEAADQGHVSTEVNFYKPENKDFSKENRETLVHYLRANGFKAEYLNNKIEISWGTPIS